LDTTITPNETHSFGYDDAYRVTTNTQGPRGSLTYTYGADDRVTTMQIANGPTTAYGYHPDGSLKTITWSPIPGNFTYVYNPNGQYSEVTFPNGQKRTYTYDDQGRLTILANTFNSNPLATFAYGYDVDQQTGQATMLGQRVTVTETLPHQGLVNALMKFGYDPQYQLSRAEYPVSTPFNGEIHSWSYDAIGNRLTNTVNTTTQNYTYLKNGQNPLNGQKLANDGSNAYTYDFNGNTLTRTGHGFAYDAENRLTSITGNETASYTYDYQGRRISKTVGAVTTTYLYDGLNLIAETAAGQTSYFLNGAGIDETLAMSRAGQISYMSSDGLGSVVATNDPAGAVSHSLVFDAWGNTKSELGTRTHPFTYTGREVGEANTLFYRARYYTATTGRFTQEDPIGFDSGTISLYSYVGGHPTSSIDPTGLAADLILVDRDDPIFKSAQRVAPMPNMFLVVAHGNPWNGIFQGIRKPLSAAELARMIRKKGWKSGTPIRLMSCRLAKSKLPAQLAKILKVPVEAPDGRVWFAEDGETYITPIAHNNRTPTWSFEELKERFPEGRYVVCFPDGTCE
ncbi:MAG: RHS repeat protein, partial [Acidobacteria bacterium]|nr:RHS repeat protein [Acidobacteriota bacterium]